MRSLPRSSRCPELFTPTGPRCELQVLHTGPHNAAVIWGEDFAEADTMKLPPIRDSIGHRRRPPALAELSDRAELLEAMSRELQRDLRELREDQADGEDL